jgi:putative acetyltransferase
MVQLRKIQPEDNPDVAALIREVFHEFNAPKVGTAYNDPTTDLLFEKFQTPASELWLAEVDGELAGCCGIYPTEGMPEGCAELVRFFMSAKYRGTGVGKELMSRSIYSAREFGYSSLYLETIPEFDRAVGIYEKQGFQYLTQPLGDTGHNSCNIWMLKQL